MGYMHLLGVAGEAGLPIRSLSRSAILGEAQDGERTAMPTSVNYEVKRISH